MVRLPALLDLLATFGGYERATWEVFARQLRDSGHLPRSKRGRGAQQATLRDAAKLIIAGMATSNPTRCDDAMERISRLKTVKGQTSSANYLLKHDFVESDDPAEMLARCMSLLGRSPDFTMTVTMDRRMLDLTISVENTKTIDSTGRANQYETVMFKYWKAEQDEAWVHALSAAWSEHVALKEWAFRAILDAVCPEEGSAGTAAA
ncbi:hypothetical protein MKK50_16295 [Methylobacterium sp. J-043]|nr:hypothetical protein [Methylobacterium sp. J-043]